MKELKSNPMRLLLARGLRIARRGKIPNEGHMRSLIYKTLHNGWHYQVECIKDSRFALGPRVVVYAFRPPRTFNARKADFYLEQAL